MRNGNGESCIDVDHINIQSERNCKGKRVSTGVQTTPLVPYRLRFWPKASGGVKCDPDGSACSVVHFRCCCRTISQFFLSQIGLTFVLVLWALAGAAAFYYTEGERRFWEISAETPVCLVESRESLVLIVAFLIGDNTI